MAFTKYSKKNYLPSEGPYGGGSTTRGGLTLFNEPVPEYSSRPDIDNVLTALTNTNAQIVIGRDRWPQDPGYAPYKERPFNDSTYSKDSGFASFQGAGAIDIVVGRGAPYPVEIPGGPSEMVPLYTTAQSKKIAGEGIDLSDGRTRHDGVIMDAARIYISQMCDLDKYFKLKKPGLMDANQGPSSGIILKADRLRMHSRRDVCIIAGGDPSPAGDKIDSCGATILDNPKIHLIVGNGQLDDGDEEDGKKTLVKANSYLRDFDLNTGKNTYGLNKMNLQQKLTQQPIPRGDNLVECLGQMCDVMKDSFEQINNFLIEQNKINGVFSNHVHGTAVGLTTQDPISQIQNVISTISNIRTMVSAFSSVYANIPAIRMNYLERSGYRYINSRHVTVS
ncbi:MAG: hypothetical protein CBD16_08375 [Betaproteobacteria bacterium TMED156]|nr:MAG: hypothetical protein CBD16_08375 [Betaproteobacteria bacterium TMED156]